MCNIAGYVGTKQAAPILLEMMRREEGFAGGYNSGIATIHNGQIFHTKLVGSIQKLIDETDALSFKGTIGICHSRSRSHSGKEWAHPFVGIQNGEVVTAYIANGNPAKNSDPEKEAAVANQLVNEGFEMRSRVYNSTSKSAYPQLSDGSRVHSSDVICQLILKNMQNGLEAPDAIERTFYDIPAERVGLLLSLANPTALAWSKINMPAFVSFADHGAYIASTPTAFPDDAGEVQFLPPLTSGWLYADKLTVTPYKEKKAKVPSLNASVLSKAYGIILEELRSGGKTFSELLKALLPLFDTTNGYLQRAALIYMIIHALQKENKINIDTVLAEPIFEGIDVPKFVVSLK